MASLDKTFRFAKYCRARNTANNVNAVEVEDSTNSDAEEFLGEVTSNEQKPWTADVTVNRHCVTIKLDSGADVTVLASNIYSELTDKPRLLKSSKKLYGPCRYELKCQGEFEALLKYDKKSWKEKIYLLDDLDRPLLGRTACHKLGIITKIDEILSPEKTPRYMKRTYPKLFEGLGCIPGE